MTNQIRDLRTRQSYTPSSAHDGAYRRGSAHDAMQVSVYRFLENTPAIHQVKLDVGTEDKPDILVLDSEWLGIESPLQEFGRFGLGRIIGFADVVHSFVARRPWVHDPRREDTFRLHRIFELKPHIDSIGGILRQCYVLNDLARRTMRAGPNEHDLKVYRNIIVVVPHDDPALGDLRAVCPWPVWPWDMEQGCLQGLGS